MKAGTAAEAMEEAAYWRVLHGLLSLFSYAISDLLPRSGTNHNELASSTSVPEEDNTPQSWLQANLMEAFSQLRTPLPRQVEVPVKLTKIHQHITAPPADSESPSADSHPVYRHRLPRVGMIPIHR